MNQERIGRLLHMISYRKLWKTMKERKISQYALYTHYGISTSFLDKLRHNENVEIRSLDILCSILDCDFGDIVEHIPDNAEPVKTLFIMLSYKSIHKNIRFFHLFMIYLLLSPSFSVTQTYLWHSLQAHNTIRFAIYRLNSAFRRFAADLQNIFT